MENTSEGRGIVFMYLRVSETNKRRLDVVQSSVEEKLQWGAAMSHDPLQFLGDNLEYFWR